MKLMETWGKQESRTKNLVAWETARDFRVYDFHPDSAN